MTIHVSAQFSHQKLNREVENEGYLMVSLRADEDQSRTPIRAILVLDVSPSMAGSKIEEMKVTAEKFINNLVDKDEVAVVVFSGEVRTVHKLASAKTRKQAIQVIRQLNTDHGLGGTNISGGFLEGIAQITSEFAGVTRILLLTDGQPNVGMTSDEQLWRMVQHRNQKCTVSTFGFGTDARHILLEKMADLGSGNYHYIKDGEIGNVFARELGGIISCKAQNIEVKVVPNQGNEVIETLNDFELKKEEDGSVLKADDIYSGEDKKLIFKLKIAKPQGKVKDRPFSVAHVHLSFDHLDKQERIKDDLNVKVEFVKPEEVDEPILEVMEQVAYLEAAAAQRQAVEFANKGDFEAAKLHITRGKRSLNSVATRGSRLGAQAMCLMDAAEQGMHQSTYDAQFGAQLAASARSAMHYHGTAAGPTVFGAVGAVGPSGSVGLANLVENNSIKEVTRMFADPNAEEDKKELADLKEHKKRSKKSK